MCTVRHKGKGFYFIFLSTHGLTGSLSVDGHDFKPGPWLTWAWAALAWPVPSQHWAGAGGIKNLPTDSWFLSPGAARASRISWNYYNVLQLGHSLLSYEAWEPLSAWVESLSIAAAMNYAIPFPFPAPAHPPICLSLFSRGLMET